MGDGLRRANAAAAATRARDVPAERLRKGYWLFPAGQDHGVVEWVVRYATLAEVGLDDGRVLSFGRKQTVKAARP